MYFFSEKGLQPQPGLEGKVEPVGILPGDIEKSLDPKGEPEPESTGSDVRAEPEASSIEERSGASGDAESKAEAQGEPENKTETQAEDGGKAHTDHGNTIHEFNYNILGLYLTRFGWHQGHIL